MDCFYFWTIIKKCHYEHLHTSFSLDGYIGVELSDYILILCLTFWITIKIFSTASILLYIPTSSELESNLHVLINSYYFPFYYYCCWYASGCEMGSHGSFDFTIANLSLQWCRRSFCVFSSLAKTLFKWSSKLNLEMLCCLFLTAFLYD